MRRSAHTTLPKPSVAAGAALGRWRAGLSGGARGDRVATCLLATSRWPAQLRTLLSRIERGMDLRGSCAWAETRHHVGSHQRGAAIRRGKVESMVRSLAAG